MGTKNWMCEILFYFFLCFFLFKNSTIFDPEMSKERELTDEEFFLQRKHQIESFNNSINFYPSKYEVKNRFFELKEQSSGFEAGQTGEKLVQSAGRVVTIRGHGKLFFFTVESEDVKIQLILNKGQSDIYQAAEFLRRGDIVGFNGFCGKSKSGEPSIFLEELKVLAPCLRVIPSSKSGLKDSETIYRKRHLDLLVNKESKERFIARSKIVTRIRNYFTSKDFIEVETPMMNAIHGGAAAKPFKTYHNELKQTLSLRIAPELYLKRLVVGGFNRIFEIGKNFRNEGIDLTHNPEFTAIEFYAAYLDYTDCMNITEELLGQLVMDLKGSLKFTYEPHKRSGEKSHEDHFSVDLDFTAPFKRLDILEELNKELGLNLTGENVNDSLDLLIKVAEERNIIIEEPKTLTRVLDKLIGEYLEPQCVNPTFITGFPTIMSPLAKEDANRKGITARFELFINCKEICNSYTELNIPSVQRERFIDQMAAHEAGDSEAMPIDEDFCKALEYGLPPTAGWGMGIDRLVMYLTNAANIRDVIFFPAMRPEH